ncbi:MAG: RidA family protein [bacterium]
MPRKVLPLGAEKIPTFGPYSSVVQVGNHYHFAGILPDTAVDASVGGVRKPTTPENQVAQFGQLIANMMAALAAVNLTMRDVIRVRVFMIGLTNASDFNRLYEIVLGGIPPVRTLVGVAVLPFGVLAEIEMDAVKQDEEPRPSHPRPLGETSPRD